MQASSFRMWQLNGIEPEELNFRTMEVTNAGYALRPEIVESTYYLYHYTRDPKYLAMGKVLFADFVKYCKTDEAYASLKSVVTKEKVTQCKVSSSPRPSNASICSLHHQRHFPSKKSSSTLRPTRFEGPGKAFPNNKGHGARPCPCQG